MTFNDELSLKEFNQLALLVYNNCGINLTADKKIIVERKVSKRITSLGLDSYDQYFSFLFSKEGMNTELVFLINEITTNKTDFFREPVHFEYLINKVLNHYPSPDVFTNRQHVNIWSSACSTGEEPYTLAMILEEYKSSVSEFSYSIFATDISTDVLEIAKMGIFKMDIAKVIPKEMKHKYLLRSKDEKKDLVRFIPELRTAISFTRLNLLDDRYSFPVKMDIVFCRNVLIYFDKLTQEKVLTNIIKRMSDGGYLFIGHSETILGMNLPLERVAPTIYRKIT